MENNEKKSIAKLKQAYSDTIDRQSEKIDLLNQRIDELLDRNHEMSEQILKFENTTKTLENDLQELQLLREEMMTSIKVLTADNEVYVQELKSTKHELFILNEKADFYPTDINTSSIPNDKNKPNPVKVTTSVNKININEDCRNILILSDQFGFNLGSHIKNNLKNINVQTFVKPNARLANVIVDVGPLTKDFTLDDFVIIVAGFNDFRYRKYPSFKEINDKIKFLGHTNVILVSVPYNSLL